MSAPALPEASAVSAAVLSALQVIQNEQLENGEMPAYLRTGPVLYSYVRLPILSAYVHDLLAIFDPNARAFGNSAVAVFSSANRTRVRKLAAEVRRAIRGFLAWSEDADGGFRQYGRGSQRAADLDTTSCSALALADRPHLNPEPPARRANRVLALSASAPPDAIVERANALRCVLRLGGDTTPLTRSLAAASGAPVTPSTNYLLDGVAAFTLGRLHHEHVGVLDASLGRQLSLGLAPPTTPLAAALYVSAQLDFGGDAASVAPGYEPLWSFAASHQSWPFQEFFAPACGSPALTAAFAASALLRAHGATEQ